MPKPPPLDRIRALAGEAVARSGLDGGALRLNWSRGGGGRGLDPPPPGEGKADPAGGARLWLQYSPCRPQFDPVRLIVSPTERRDAASLLSRCKTFAYGSAVQARRQAAAASSDDALLPSTAGGLSCATTANLLVRRDGHWWTPPLTSGCLPGVMRGRALDLGVALEAPWPLEVESLQGEGLLLNSLGCRPIRSLAGRPLPLWPDPERFWRGLFQDPA